MSPRALAVNVLTGVVLVLIWGVFTYVASSETEFKSLFLGGLSNFVFFIGGVALEYTKKFSHDSVLTGSTPTIDSALVIRHKFNIVTAVYIALATILAIVLLNLFQDGFTASLARLEGSHTISFTAEGYRDIQLFAGSSFGILCVLGAMLYGFHLGSVRPDTTYLTVLAGVALSLGIYELLYILFGLFFNYQAFQIFQISPPAILGSMGPVIQKIVGLGITAAISLFMGTIWTTLFWLSIKLGGLLSRGPVLHASKG